MKWAYHSGRNSIDITIATFDGRRKITYCQSPKRVMDEDEAGSHEQRTKRQAARTAYKPPDKAARAAAKAARAAAERAAAEAVAAAKVAADTTDSAAKAAADDAATTDSAAKADALLTKDDALLVEPTNAVGPDANPEERFAALIADTMALACEFESALALLATETEAARAALDEADIQLLIMRTTLGEVDYDDDCDLVKLILELEVWQKEEEVDGLNSRVTALYARIYEKLEAFACAEKKVDELHALARRAAYKKKRAAEDKDKNAAALGFSRRVTGKSRSRRRHVPGFFDTLRCGVAYLPPMCLHIGRHDSVFEHSLWVGR